MGELLVNGAWIAAVSAPWAVSPHPNFSEDTVTGPGLLALVSQFRLRDLDRYSELLPEDEASWVMELVDAARRSVLRETIREAADDLWKLCQRIDLPLDARLAAALFASVADVEVDELGRAISNLLGFEAAMSLLPSSRTAGLAQGLLRMQIAARQFDQVDYGSAMATLDEVERSLLEEGEWEQFPVSLGISWGSSAVLDDIQTALSTHVLELRSRLEGLGGKTWVEVVRSKSSWLDFRGEVVAGARDRKYVESSFEKRVGSSSHRRTIVSSNPITTRALEVLLLAELTGDVNGFMNGRVALGQLRILQEVDKVQDAEPWEFQEALRLFRKARSKDGLQRTIDSIYLQGPEEALIADARLIIQRSDFPIDATAFDLMVLGAASHYLGTEELERSTDAALEFLSKPRSVPGSEIADRQNALRSIVRLLPESGKNEDTASVVLATIKSSHSLDVFERDFLQIMDVIDWDDVAPATVEAWRGWGERHAATAESTSELADRSRYLFRERDHEEILNGMPESDIPLHLALHSEALDDIPPETLKAAVTISSSDLRQIRADARAGHMRFGGVDSTEVAVLLAAAFDIMSLWNEVIELLADKDVPQELKERSVSRIVELGPTLSGEVQEKLRASWGLLMESPRQGFFVDPDPSLQFTDAVRLGVIIKALTKDEAVAWGTELACSRSAVNRRSACELIRDIAETHEEWTWAQILLLQLIHDTDANVRPAAAKNLAVVGPQKTAVSSLVTTSLLECLDSGGIRIPLMALHGLQRVGEQVETYGRDLVRKVSTLASSHEARVIREAARRVLEGAMSRDYSSGEMPLIQEN